MEKYFDLMEENQEVSFLNKYFIQKASAGYIFNNMH